ncbi:hypothetical protein ACOMHN_047622 [Nucella lapillus]
MKQPSQGGLPSALHSSGSAFPQECYHSAVHYGTPDSTRCTNASAGGLFSDLDEGGLARADSAGQLDMDKDGASQQMLKHQDFYRHSTPPFCLPGQDSAPMSQLTAFTMHPAFSGEGDSMFDTLVPASCATGSCSVNSVVDQQRYFPHGMVMPSSSVHDLTGHSAGGHDQIYSSMYTSSHSVVNSAPFLPSTYVSPMPGDNAHSLYYPPQPQHLYENDCHPQELERFAERFKQRRIKLGVTQADVGSALAELKIPGVGSLSQSTICRFESLTLSHNNMTALKPILLAWLEEAELRAYESKAEQQHLEEEKKRKRTSITAPEKRSLEAYFAVQPRPSGDKIAQIAEKLDLRKNVVRVWFCNQRQKQKRLKFSANVVGHH